VVVRRGHRRRDGLAAVDAGVVVHAAVRHVRRADRALRRHHLLLLLLVLLLPGRTAIIVKREAMTVAMAVKRPMLLGRHLGSRGLWMPVGAVRRTERH